ncbi:hypothetical protein ACRRTK_020634 [Alexandromys fortis]
METTKKRQTTEVAVSYCGLWVPLLASLESQKHHFSRSRRALSEEPFLRLILLYRIFQAKEESFRELELASKTIWSQEYPQHGASS